MADKVTEFINLECAECGAVELRMKVFDDIAMCPRCFVRTFRSDYPADEKPAVYQELLKQYKLKVSDYRYTENNIVNIVGVVASGGAARAKIL